MKSPTLRKIKNRGLVAIRYRSPNAVRHGWIVKQGARGAMTVRLVGDERNTKLTRAEVRHVIKIGA